MRKCISLDHYDFELPQLLIAQSPPPQRRDARLLQWRADGSLHCGKFPDILSLFRPDDLLVFNESRVIPGRLLGSKKSGTARVEVLLLRPRINGADTWEVLLKPARRFQAGTTIILDEGPEILVGDFQDGPRREVVFPADYDVLAYCRTHGHMPLPPYIQRADTTEDQDRYQTVFSKKEGSAAAPTAGLHFDDEILAELKARCIRTAHVTLHVGLGTFRPLEEDDLERGQLHEEYYEVEASVMEVLKEQKMRGGRIIAIGTTACRCLESLDLDASGMQAGDTNIFIAPGDEFRWVDVLLTNFHLPRSSLLRLVAAFAGQRWRKAYDLAVKKEFRFFSYGDANWIERST